MDIKKKRERWDSWYTIAVEYYREYGNLLVPLNYETADGKLLGRWIAQQRIAYKGLDEHNTLTEEQIRKLENIGMDWNYNSRLYNWNNWYDIAKEYYEENGDLLVSRDYINKDGKALGRWVDKQRQYYRDNKLASEKIKKLDELEMVWELIRKVNSHINLATSYYNHYGNLEIPEDFKTKDGINYDSDGHDLGIWYKNLQYYYENDLLTDEEIEKLESIGMVWNNNKIEWEEFYNHAKEYYNEKGNLNVLLNYVSKDDFELGLFIQRERKKYYSDPLGYNRFHKQMLHEIGMVWNQKEVAWEQSYDLLKRYYDANGNIQLPSNFKTKDGVNFDPNGVALNRWLILQRKYYRESSYGLLNGERIKRLEELGMIWNVKEYQFINRKITEKNIDSIKERLVNRLFDLIDEIDMNEIKENDDIKFLNKEFHDSFGKVKFK